MIVKTSFIVCLIALVRSQLLINPILGQLGGINPLGNNPGFLSGKAMLQLGIANNQPTSGNPLWNCRNSNSGSTISHSSDEMMIIFLAKIQHETVNEKWTCMNAQTGNTQVITSLAMLNNSPPPRTYAPPIQPNSNNYPDKNPASRPNVPVIPQTTETPANILTTTEKTVTILTTTKKPSAPLTPKKKPFPPPDDIIWFDSVEMSTTTSESSIDQAINGTGQVEPR